MAVKTRAQLAAEIVIIRDEVVVDANDATRVGTTLENLLDSVALATEVHLQAVVVAVANVAALTGTTTLDSVAVVADDVVHLTAQSSGDENGPWVIQAGPCPILQVKSKTTDGYAALQLGFGEKSKNKVNRPMQGHFKRAGTDPTRVLLSV